MTVYISFPSYSLGSQQSTLEIAHQNGQLYSSVDALQDAGFDKHNVCLPEETAYDLAKSTLDDMIATYPEAQALLPSVDLIIYVTCLPLNGNLGDTNAFTESKDVKHYMDFPASRLQADYGMGNAFVMGLNQQACTGMLGSLRVAKAMLESEKNINTVLCITADRFPEGAAYEQAYNLISDGGAACIVSRERHSDASPCYELIGAHHITNGAMATADDEETAGFYFSYSHRMITDLCATHDLSPSDINWIVPQNTNRKAWRILSSVLRFEFDNILMPTIGTVGHCISGDNIINLKTVQSQETMASGDIILLPMAGFGLNWSSVLLRKVGN